MHKLRENAEKELRAIEEKGLTTSNLDNAYKLVEIMKGVDKIEMMQDGEGGYSRDREDYSRNRDMYPHDDYDMGNSYRRGRNQRTGQYMHRPGGYSRLAGDDTDMDEYKNRKREYSNSRDEGSKEKMLDALVNVLSGIHGWVRQMKRDAECREEREIIQDWCQKIADI